jgi:hypothetical protein
VIRGEPFLRGEVDPRVAGRLRVGAEPGGDVVRAGLVGGIAADPGDAGAPATDQIKVRRYTLALG